MPRELDLSEFNKLEQLLKDAGIPYEREDREDVPRKEVEAMGLRCYFDHHEIYYPSKAEHLSDAVISYGSYGSASGLLEQMGLLPPVTQDSVQGELFAVEVFERWKEHWESTHEEANSVDEKECGPIIGVRCYDDCYWTRDDYGDKYTPPSSECGKDDGSFERLNLEPCYSERDDVDVPDCPFYLNYEAIKQMESEYHRGEPLQGGEIIKFILDGCDIAFTAEAPADITLAQLLKQCDRIKPDWCACGIRTATTKDYGKVEISIGYDSIAKNDPNAPCQIVEVECESVQ